MWCCSINHSGRECNCKAEFEKINKYIKAMEEWDEIMEWDKEIKQTTKS